MELAVVLTGETVAVRRDAAIAKEIARLLDIAQQGGMCDDLAYHGKAAVREIVKNPDVAIHESAPLRFANRQRDGYPGHAPGFRSTGEVGRLRATGGC